MEGGTPATPIKERRSSVRRLMEGRARLLGRSPGQGWSRPTYAYHVLCYAR
jgi:hypothetical protein